MQSTFTDGIVIYADTREMNTRIISILKKYCNVREKQLAVGDYILSDRVCVERKSSQDFLQSIIDKRLFIQLEELKNNFKKPVLIIEGDDLLDNARNVHPNAIRGALASITIDYAIPIIWTQTQMDTAHQLYMIAKREQIDEKRHVGIRGKKKTNSMAEVQEFLVAGMPKISTEKARRLLAHFKTPEKIFTASETELKKVEGIGEELAKQIRRIMTEKYK
ncbi:MAG: hypothetical protein HY514_03620 [Candidatus Aenigmarchaeota archaeon]|nr:hypothetical protein [Candidatus Aenigmarchaeota archaeon]